MTDVNTEHWIDRISEYLDDELDTLDRREAEAHFATCAECARALEDVREIVARAQNLPDRGPERDLWEGIAAGMEEADTGVIDLSRRREGVGTRAPRSFRFTLPQLAAAGIALALVSGGVSWSLAGTRTAVEVPVAVDPGDAVVQMASTAADITPEVAEELAELTAVLERHRDELQPGTLRILEKNLTIIDRAIEESVAALESDPLNAYLKGHVDRAIRRKVDYLREMTQIAGWTL